MTQRQKTTRRERHIIVDVLALTGGGIFANSVRDHAWSSIIGALVIIVIALWLDRRSIRAEEEPEEVIEHNNNLKVEFLDRKTNTWHEA